MKLALVVLALFAALYGLLAIVAMPYPHQTPEKPVRPDLRRTA